MGVPVARVEDDPGEAYLSPDDVSNGVVSPPESLLF
jgi:hypothetical protein